MKTTSAVIKSAVTKRYDRKTMALLGIALAYQMWPSAVAAEPRVAIEGQAQSAANAAVQTMSSQDLAEIRQQPSLRSIK